MQNTHKQTSKNKSGSISDHIFTAKKYTIS